MLVVDINHVTIIIICILVCVVMCVCVCVVIVAVVLVVVVMSSVCHRACGCDSDATLLSVVAIGSVSLLSRADAEKVAQLRIQHMESLVSRLQKEKKAMDEEFGRQRKKFMNQMMLTECK